MGCMLILKAHCKLTLIRYTRGGLDHTSQPHGIAYVKDSVCVAQTVHAD